jgi:DNA uptake protein ComE-like DNA-binding protein
LAFALVAASSLVRAEDPKAARPAPAKVGPSAKVYRSKAKKAPRHNLVDLNHATKSQLKKVPGITDEVADKIIAGRPYRTKAHLVTHNIVSNTLYGAIKDRVEAVQPKTLPR